MRQIIFLILAGWIAGIDQPVTDFVAARRGVIGNQRWETAYDFTESFKEAKVSDTLATHVTSEQVDQVIRPGIFQHPNPPGQGMARLHFPQVSFPALSPGELLVLHFYIALSERISDEMLAQTDGCRFSVAVDGQNMFDKTYSQRDWFEWAVDLTYLAGKTVPVTFLMDPLTHSNADWALWGEPKILIEGRKAEAKRGPRFSPLSVSQLDLQPDPRRVIHIDQAANTATIVAVMDEHLDLAAQLDTHGQSVTPSVPLAPEIVVGEGPAPENHTFIRILNHYGIPRVQFLAYPPSIRGGVNVAVGHRAEGDRVIVAAPLLDTATDCIRLFTPSGGLLGSFQPAPAIERPYALAVGNFIPNHPGDEIALTTCNGVETSRSLQIHGITGSIISEIGVPDMFRSECVLSTQPGEQSDDLLILVKNTGQMARLSSRKGEAGLTTSTLAGHYTGAFPSAFDDAFWMTNDHPADSVVQQVARDGTFNEINVGKREQLFWYQWHDWRERGGDAPQDGRYVRLSRFEHIRTDFMSTSTPDTTDWTGPRFEDRANGLIGSYMDSLPRLWEPCFTHRQPQSVFDEWNRKQDDETGLPMYNMLTRNNHIVEYSEFESKFFTSTYGFGWPALENYYILPLRAFLHLLVEPFRKNPEHFVGLEPNHEHEIAVEEDGSKGDYNLKMVEGFYDYLHRRTGGSSSEVSRLYGISLEELGGYFDAPRNWQRGGWDDYNDANPFYKEWIAYNRHVVNRRLAQTYREALLAGFPPDSILSHQIPDVYALGSLQSFSTVLSRFSPIDYAMTAGVGFGFTRYGVWYQDKENIVQASRDSGFGMYSIGEYQALTPSIKDASGQLFYIHQNGGYSVHCMRWPEGHDKGYNASMLEALRWLLEKDPPRPGVTGGVGQVRPFQEGKRRYNIVSIGTGLNHQGLLKSVNSDGTWEGTVYVTPFRAHIGVSEVALLKENGVILSEGVDDLRPGEQLEFVAEATCAGPDGHLRFSVLNDNLPLPGLVAEIPLGVGQKSVRYVLRIQLTTPEIRLCVEPTDSVALTNVHLYRETQQVVAPHIGITAAEPHQGGITFDILPAD